MTTPPNLEALRLVPNPAQRALSAKAYIRERLDAVKEARRIRDQAIATLVNQGAALDAIAVGCGVSVAHVKLVKRANAITE